MGAVVGIGDRARVRQFLRVVTAELDRRRLAPGSAAGSAPGLVVAVDGWGALRADLEASGDYDEFDQLDRVLAEGPQHGIVMALSADRVGSVPLAVLATVTQKWVFQHG